MKIKKPLSERFWEKVNIQDENSCWNWTGSCDTLKRGIISVNGRGRVAPRVGYFLAYGVDPGSLCVLHKCDNPTCVNPSHLYLGTMKDNAADRKERGRAIYGKGEDSRAHKLTNSQVDAIRKMYKPRKFSYQKIADIYGVSKKCILNIIHNRTYIQ